MNAAIEFKDTIKGKPDVICAYITDVYSENIRSFLPLGYTQEQYDNFILDLDFTYDNGFGGQQLDGIIWFKDGTWADRGEYDGSEWWNYHKCPQVPTFLYPLEEELPFDQANYWDGDETSKQ
jgi:hypothetical protein